MAKDVGDFFSDFWDWFTKILQEVFDFSNITNFISNFWDAAIHFIIPTDAQWEDIKLDYTNMGEAVGRHIPFVGFFSEELKKAQQTVEKTDFLVITIPSFSYNSGIISISSDATKSVNVAEAYEPYRAYVRGGLFLIVVGLATVYMVKYVLNYQRSKGE